MNVWDDVERFANHLFASQLQDVSWVLSGPDREDTDLKSYRDVPARYCGAFTGRTMANDLLNEGRYDTMGCCVAAGGRALGLLHDHVVSRHKNGIFINLWLSCDTPDASVAVCGGCMTIVPKTDGRIFVRVPGWMLDTQPNRIHGDGMDYLDLGFCQAGVPVQTGFLAPLVTREERFCGEILSVIWQGHEVRDVQPHGIRPLYGVSLTNEAEGGAHADLL